MDSKYRPTSEHLNAVNDKVLKKEDEGKL